MKFCGDWLKGKATKEIEFISEYVPLTRHLLWATAGRGFKTILYPLDSKFRTTSFYRIPTTQREPTPQMLYKFVGEGIRF